MAVSANTPGLRRLGMPRGRDFGPRLVTPALARARARARQLGLGLIRLEPWSALPVALALLLYPNPLVAPAILVGALPSVARCLLIGRPWRPTAFDLPL